MTTHAILSQKATPKKHVLSFTTFDGKIKYFADGAGELSNGEQTYDIRKAKKYDTSKQAAKENEKLETHYFRSTTFEMAPDLWVL